MFVDVESVGTQRARERRNKGWHMLQGACWTVGIITVFMLAVGAGMAWREPQIRPIRQAHIDARPTCMGIENFKHCRNERITVCQTTINGRKVYSSDAC